MPNDQLFSAEETAFVLRALQQSARPLNLKKLQQARPKSGPVKAQQLPELLKQLVQGDRIRVHRARSTVYWLPDLEAQAATRIVEELTERPLTPTELRGKFKSLLVGWPRAKREELLERLLKERRVYRVAPLTGKAKLLSVRPQLTPQDAVKLALHLAVTKLAAQGVAAEQVFAVARGLLEHAPATTEMPNLTAPMPEPTAADPEHMILERMLQLKPAAANGALVSLSELRHALTAEIPSKTAFDQAVLRLAATGRVALHHHDYPSSLNQEEREALVLDERGNHYVGIALRM
jgi:hypothetical protein